MTWEAISELWAVGASRWWQWISAVSVQFAVLAVLAAGLARLCRPLGPKVVHLVWLVVLLRLLVPASLNSPVGLLPGSVEGGVSGAVEIERAPDAAPILPPRTATAMPPPAGDAGTRREGGFSSQAPSSDPTTAILFAAWFAGSLALATLLGARGMADRRRRRRHRVEPPEWLEVRIANLRQRLGIGRTVRLELLDDSDALDGPGLGGWLRPRLVIPSRLLEWRREELDAALVHELVHLGRGDHWCRALQNLVQIVYFFHPLVWWVSHRLTVERERACDDEVTAFFDGRVRPYVEALLRFADASRRALPAAARLELAASARPLGRRLERLARSKPPPRRRRWLTVPAVVLAAGLALAAGEPRAAVEDEPVPAETVTRETRRVRAIVTWDRFYRAQTVAEVDLGEPIRSTGDLVPGELLRRGPTDEEVLAPEAEGEVWVSALIGPEGSVLSAEVERGLSAAVDRMLLERVLGTVYEPWVERGRGPVIVGASFRFGIRAAGAPWPEEAAAAAARASLEPVDGLVATVTRLRGRRAGVGGRQIRPLGVPGWPELPAEASFPRLTFQLAIEASGEVVEAIHWSGPEGRRSEELEPVAATLVDWLETLRFEPLPGKESGEWSFLGTVDLQVDRGEVRSLVDREVLGDWQPAFFAHYELPPESALRLVPPPFVPERRAFLKVAHPTQHRAMPGGPDALYLVQKPGAERVEYRGQCFGCGTLGAVLRAAGFEEQTVEIDPELARVAVPGDLILREGAAPEVLLRDLERELAEHHGLELRFERVEAPRPTIVLRGELGDVAPERDDPERVVLHIYRDELASSSGSGGRFEGSLALLAEMLGTALAMPVVDETVGPPAPQHEVRVHRSAYRTSDVERVLDNLEAQTDLDLAIEIRPTTLLRVTRAPGRVDL